MLNKLLAGSVEKSGVRGLLTAENVLNIVRGHQYPCIDISIKRTWKVKSYPSYSDFYIQLIPKIFPGAPAWPPSLAFLFLHSLFVLLLQISQLMSFFATSSIYSTIQINYYELSDSIIQSNLWAGFNSTYLVFYKNRGYFLSC